MYACHKPISTSQVSLATLLFCPLLSLTWTVILYFFPTSLAGKRWLAIPTAPVVEFILNLAACTLDIVTGGTVQSVGAGNGCTGFSCP